MNHNKKTVICAGNLGWAGLRMSAAALLLMLVLRAGLSQAADPSTVSSDTQKPEDSWALYWQATNVTQGHPAFTSPYSGANSLYSGSNNNETSDVTLFAGLRLPDGGELWANPEIDQGFGLSNTLGMAGYPSGEAYKVGANTPYFRLPRLFYRKTIDLGGTEQRIEAGANQFGRRLSENNLTVTIGKFSVVDVFDTNTYSHDPRSDFMNWSIVESGAFDYAADAWGYTYGASAEWTQSWWTLRGGLFDLSTVPNTTKLDPKFSQYEAVVEAEERHQWLGHPGKLKWLAFVNDGRMGSYANAVQLASQTGGTPQTALVRQRASQTGIALNFEQEVVTDLGAFSRASKNSGRNEAFDFTEINESLAIGLSLKGARWGRMDDTVGLAAVENRLSSPAQRYFAAGGMGILIGDGRLNYAPEQIMETYYSVQASSHWFLTFDYQHVIDPAYNHDRGPVDIFGIRLHCAY